jgi:hypothetical protein
VTGEERVRVVSIWSARAVRIHRLRRKDMEKSGGESLLVFGGAALVVLIAIMVLAVA